MQQPMVIADRDLIYKKGRKIDLRYTKWEMTYFSTRIVRKIERNDKYRTKNVTYKRGREPLKKIMT